MITIREILSLVNSYGLDNVKFFSIDGKVPVIVTNGKVFFEQSDCLIPVSSLTEDQLNDVDEENDYWTKEEFDYWQRNG